MPEAWLGRSRLGAWLGTRIRGRSQRTRNPFPAMAALAMVVGAGATGASALSVDLRPGAGSSGTVNGVRFEFDDLQPFGSGVVQSFVRIQADGTERGYNTSNPDSFPFNEVPPPGGFTRDLRFGELQQVGENFLFALDINEPSGGSTSLLSLDALQIYISDIGSQNTMVLANLGTLVYDLDLGEDSVVLMDYDNAPGSGVSDMLMSVPASVFAGASPDDFVILYSQFGDTENSGDGYEEWAHVVPEPGTLGLLLSGFAGLSLARRRRVRAGAITGRRATRP